MKSTIVVKFHDPQENISKYCYISNVLHIIHTVNIFRECSILQTGHNWLGCHFQQTLPWPNESTWHGQFFQGRFLNILDHVHFISSFSLWAWPYDHFYYWLVLLSNLVFLGAQVSFFLFQVSSFCFAHWHEVISLTIEARFPFPHFI